VVIHHRVGGPLDKTMKVIVVIVIVLVLTVTSSLSFLVMKNFGLENVKVMKNVILSSDLEGDGKIKFLVQQYSTEIIGYRNANEFIKKRGIGGYRYPNSDESYPEYYKDIYLVIKDPRTSTIEWHLLKKDTIWGSCVLKIFEGKTYVVWTETEKGRSGSFIKYGRISEGFVLIEDGIVLATRVYGFQLSVEILSAPIRLVVAAHEGIFVVNGTNVTQIYREFAYNFAKGPMNQLYLIDNNATQESAYAIEVFDKDLKLVEHDEVKMENNTTYYTPKIFMNKGVPYVYYYQCLQNSLCLVYQYFVHPIHNGTLNTTDPDKFMIANLTFLTFPHNMVYGAMPPITNDKLTLYFGVEKEYPMSIRTFNVSDNFSQEPIRYFNFTITSMYYIAKEYYVVGYENRWTYQKSFPQIMTIKIDN
jgi:hypothetical protein